VLSTRSFVQVMLVKVQANYQHYTLLHKGLDISQKLVKAKWEGSGLQKISLDFIVHQALCGQLFRLENIKRSHKIFSISKTLLIHPLEKVGVLTIH